jgi:CBS domain-containing protein
MQVQEIMHPNVHVAAPNMTIVEAARRMRANNIGALPVGENDRLFGMVTDRDMWCARSRRIDRPAIRRFER